MIIGACERSGNPERPERGCKLGIRDQAVVVAYETPWSHQAAETGIPPGRFQVVSQHKNDGVTPLLIKRRPCHATWRQRLPMKVWAPTR